MIREGTFRANEDLTRVTIPASVTEIKYAAFRDCDKLTDVYFTGTQAQWEAINIDYTVDGKGATKTESLSAPDHQDTNSNETDNTTGQLENEGDTAASVTEETLSQTDKESGGVDNLADAPTEAFGGNNTAEQTGIEKEQPKGFPWVATCISAAVLLAGGGVAAWFMLRKKP